MKRGSLLVFEGLDGSGKSTQLALLAEILRSAGHRVVTTREPTRGAFGQRIRAMASGDAPRVAAEEEVRWFVEDRREHVRDVIAPELARGALVLSDRYFLSTVAYQGARGLDPATLLARMEAEFPHPDLALVLEIDPQSGLRRVRDRGGRAEPAFEDASFLTRVAEILRALPCAYVERIDARGSAETVHARVLESVGVRLGLP